MTPFDPEERLVTVSDVKRLYIALRRRLKKWAIVGALAAFCGVGLVGPRYQIEASFKEEGEATEALGALQEMLRGPALLHPPAQAACLMTSHRVLKPLIEKLGLNVVALPKERWQWLRSYYDVIRAEIGLSIADPDSFRFHEVSYGQDKPLCLTLQFIDPDHFIVYTANQKKEGMLASPIHLPELDVRFTVQEAPSSLRTGAFYRIYFYPWITVATKLEKALMITTHPHHKSVYDLAFSTRDRHKGVQVLNELMRRYQQFLKQEHDQLAAQQLDYLEKRQGQQYAQLRALFDENVDYVSYHLGQNGFVSLDQEMQSLMGPYQQMYNKALQIDISLSRLDSWEMSVLEEGPLAREVHPLMQKINDLNQQKEMLELSLGEEALVAQSDELSEIDASTARPLFLEYNSKLDQAQAAIQRYAECKKEMARPDFELATLNAILSDTFSQKILSEAVALGLERKDERYHSAKEEKRIAEDLAIQRKTLSDHLDQLAKLEELNVSLIRAKMKGLQKIQLEGIGQQIAILRQQAKEMVQEHRHALLHEKELLGQKMEEIRSQAATLPQKWRLEKWLNLQTDLTSQMMQTMTEVVESKTIASQLHHVSSKPLDEAILPPLPRRPHLCFWTLLGALGLPALLFASTFIRRLYHGFPLSLEKLHALRLPVVGVFGRNPDLEVLRRIALFSAGGHVIGLIQGQGPDYSCALGENLARASVRSIFLRCDFLYKLRQDEGPGLLQMWQGDIDAPPIHSKNGFDTVVAGGYTPFGAEILQSARFRAYVTRLKSQYQQVYLLLRTPLAAAESLALLPLCDKAVVTVIEEKTEELTPFTLWAYHEDNCRLTFVTHS